MLQNVAVCCKGHLGQVLQQMHKFLCSATLAQNFAVVIH